MTPLITASKYSDEDLVEILKMFDYLEISIEGHDEESYAIIGGIKGFNTFREQLSRIEQLIKKNNISCYLRFAFRSYDKYSLYRSEIYKHIKLCYGKNIDIENIFFVVWEYKQGRITIGYKINY